MTFTATEPVPYAQASQVCKYAMHKDQANAQTIVALQRAIRTNDAANEQTLHELERAIIAVDNDSLSEAA